eukprot:m.354425 g.354425  ORF g.354425 m.354425 type:complete len:196 (+) comp17015_c0_seq1:227-814(+)
MDKHLFNLRMAVKQLERAAKKCEKESKAERLKIKKDLEKGNQENARIHAENAIRQKNQHTQYLRMSARIDAVAQRVQTALTMRQVTGSMKGVVKAMDKAMSSMNLEQMSLLMEKFEKQFEDLDVQASVMDGAMRSSATSTMPEHEVDDLMSEVREQHGIELSSELMAPSTAVGTASEADVNQAELSERLARLRQS